MKNKYIKLSSSQMFAIVAELEFVDRELSHELQDLFVEALYLGPQQSNTQGAERPKFAPRGALF
jgi:hypothetical protein